jgi:hypothetical protein
MAAQLTSKALTTLDVVKSELGISVTTHDDYLIRKINEASAQICRYLDRDLGYAVVSGEEHKAAGGKYLCVERYPITALTAVYYDSAALDSTEYETYSAESGLLISVNGSWTNASDYYNSISPMRAPGTARKLYTVDYSGGYVLPKDAEAGSVTGSNTETFDFSGGKVLDYATDTGSTTVTFIDGDFATPSAATAAEVKVVIDAAIASGALCDSACSIVSGAIKLSTTGKDSSNWIEADETSTAAVLLGLDGDKHYGTGTLPADLESACIDMVVSKYSSRGSDKSIVSEKLLQYSVNYGSSSTSGSGSGGGRGSMSAAVLEALNPYRRYC